MKLQVRMNTRTKCVEFKEVPVEKPSIAGGAALSKAQDFVRAFCLGFEVDDSLAILRMDDLYVDSFEVKDVRVGVYFV